MEWVLVASLTFVNGVEGTAEFVFPTEDSCKRVVESIQSYDDKLFGIEQFNVTCEPMISIPEGENPDVELY